MNWNPTLPSGQPSPLIITNSKLQREPILSSLSHALKMSAHQLKDMGAIISPFHQERNTVKSVEYYFARLLITEQVHVW